MNITNKMELWRIILISTFIVLSQGCLVFPYPSPEVKGSVVDASTKKPIEGAKIKSVKRPDIFCKTLSDGSFDLPAHSHWGFCFLMPGDYLVISSLSVSVTNYQNFTNSYLGTHDGKPVVLERPIELLNKFNQ